MVDQLRSWFKENHTLVIFLAAQAVALGAAAAASLAYFTRLETRVMILETRGAEYSVARMNKTDERITIIEQRQSRNEAQITRIVDIMTKGLPK
jgi:hypothetical protein